MEAEIADDLASQASTLPRQHRLRLRPLRLRTLIPYFFLSPAILLFILFFALPVGYAIWQSLFQIHRDALGLSAPSQVFAGLANYQRAITDPELYQGFERVLVYGLIEVPIMLILAVFFALLLDSAATHARARAFFRITFFLPYAIPGVIAVYIWGYLYTPQLSPITQVLTVLHLGGPDFLGPTSVLWSIGNIAIWGGTGYQVLVIFSTLQAISPNLYEAARIDGCSEWQIAWFIKLRMILPAVALISMFSVIGALQLFAEPMLLGNLSSSITSSFTPNMYLYKTALDGGNYSYAAALSIVWALLTSFFSFSVLRFSRKRTGV